MPKYYLHQQKEATAKKSQKNPPNSCFMAKIISHILPLTITDKKKGYTYKMKPTIHSGAVETVFEKVTKEYQRRKAR